MLAEEGKLPLKTALQALKSALLPRLLMRRPRCTVEASAGALIAAPCILRKAFHLQVFIPEQVAYSKPDLERHMRSGDLTGPMAESGFKGHPQCRSVPTLLS